MFCPSHGHFGSCDLGRARNYSRRRRARRCVAADVGEVIAARAVVFLEMTDDGLNGVTPFELALDLRREAGLLATRVELELHAPARLK